MTERIFDLEKFIDREFEQELFEDLLRMRDHSRILAIRASGGMGKSSLLEKFQYRCRVVKPRIPVSLVALDQLPDASPLAVIRQIVQQLSRLGADFPMFNKNEGARIAGDFCIGQIDVVHVQPTGYPLGAGLRSASRGLEAGGRRAAPVPHVCDQNTLRVISLAFAPSLTLTRRAFAMRKMCIYAALMSSGLSAFRSVAKRQN